MTMTDSKTIERLPVNEAFARPANRAAIERAAAALRLRNFDARIVADAVEAREMVLTLLPEGTEVGEGASLTLDQIGVTEIVEKSGRYDAIRPKTRAMDRATKMREIRKLAAAPDVQINSVHALTEDGRMVIASGTGSQLGPIGFGAGKVVLVVGAQKIVPDLETAYRRVEEYSYPLEDAKMQELYGARSSVSKMLILNRDSPGRTTVILVAEPVGT
jgi:L-lactate utilization protein LutC